MGHPRLQFGAKADLPVGFPYRFNSSISNIFIKCVYLNYEEKILNDEKLYLRHDFIPNDNNTKFLFDEM